MDPHRPKNLVSDLFNYHIYIPADIQLRKSTCMYFWENISLAILLCDFSLEMLKQFRVLHSLHGTIRQEYDSNDDLDVERIC